MLSKQPGSSAPPSIPEPVAASLLRLPLYPLRLAPARLLGAVMERLLAVTLAQHERDGELDFLEGRKLQIRVEDVGLEWIITRAGGRWRVLDGRREADAVIRGQVREFVLLASRREDPDTLFFQRQLVIEGDVEFGLQAKNLLDSLEWEALPTPLRWLLANAGSLAVQVGG